MVGANSASGNKFYGLNITNGSILWSFTNGVANNIGVISGQALVDYNTTRVYFTSRAGGSGNSVWCLNVSTNPPTLVWAAGGMGDNDADINLASNTLYAGTTAGKVYALNTNGTQKWTGPWLTGGGPVKGLIWVSGTKLFFSTTSGVNAINDNGNATAPTAFYTTPVSISSPTTPLVYNNRVYVGGIGKVYSIDATSATPATPLSVTLGDPAVPFQVGSPTRDSTSNLLMLGSEPGHVYAVTPF
jgi:outer membrane protein assembly factor BamB